MKVNAEQTVVDRLRIVIGFILVFVGAGIFFIIGSFDGYEKDWTWMIGGAMIVLGVLIAGSQTLVNFVRDLTT